MFANTGCNACSFPVTLKSSVMLLPVVFAAKYQSIGFLSPPLSFVTVLLSLRNDGSSLLFMVHVAFWPADSVIELPDITPLSQMNDPAV